nr:uncharacterized protein LOC123770938 isoform X2 [Procambarus clarkii]
MMSNAGNCEAPVATVFLAELQSLPIINDAFTVATDLYKKTQEYRCVGMAVGVASVGMRAAALPLSALGQTVGGWTVVDQWACHGLHTVKTWAPSITKPTTEIVGDVRENLLKAVAGCPTATSTLSGALTARAEKTVSKLQEYQTGRMVVAAADDLVTKAHVFIDEYLPSVDGETSDSDGEGGIVVKVSSLAAKTQRRVCRAAHDLVYTDATRRGASANSIATCADKDCKMSLELNGCI